MSNKIQFEISASVTGSFINNDTLQVTFDAGGGHAGTSTKIYVWTHDDSASNSTYHSPAGDGAEATLIDGETFPIGSQLNEKSFIAPFVRDCEEVQILITGSHARNPYANNNSRPAGDLQFDNIAVSVHQAKVEVTDKGILAFSSPTRYFKADKSGVTLKGGSVEAQVIKTNQLEVYGSTAIFSDIVASDNSPYSGSMSTIKSGSDGGDVGLEIQYARGDHAHGLEASVVDNVIKDYELQRITASTARIEGDMFVSGTLETIDLVVSRISSSVIHITGSNEFGDSASQDHHYFTGSIHSSGSVQEFFGSNIDLDAQYRIDVNDTLFVTSSGKVGVNIATPTSLLHLSSSGTLSDIFRVDNSKSVLGLIVQEDSDGDLALTMRDKDANSQIFLASNSDSYFKGNLSIGNINHPEKFTVLGNISASGRLYVGDGAEATPSIAFGLSGQEDTGLYRRSNNVIGFSAGGDGQMTLNESGVTIGEGYVASNNTPGTANSLIVEGKIGIGTPTPQELLHIAGTSDPTLVIQNTGDNQANSGKISFREASATTERVNIRYDGSDNKLIIDTEEVSNAFVVDRATGKIGIGTSSPTKNLHIKPSSGTSQIKIESDVSHAELLIDADTGFDPNVEFQVAGATKWVVGVDSTNSDLFQIGTSSIVPNDNKFVINTSGQVGIGTTTPTQPLTVEGNISASGTSHKLGGKLGIGTSPSNNVELDVRGDALFTGKRIYFAHDGGTDANNDFMRFSDTAWGDAAGVLSLHADQARSVGTGSVGMALFTDGMYSKGKVGIGTTSPTSSLNIATTSGDKDESFRSSMLTLTPTSLINNDGFTGITMETSTNIDGYGISMGARRYTTDGSPAFVINTHYNDLAGTERFRITKDGNVGIGTDSPLSRLHIRAGDSGVGSADLLSGGDGGLVIDDSDSAILTLVGGTSNDQVIAFGDSDSANVGRLTYSNTKDALEVWTGGSQRAEFDDYGVKIIGDISASGKIIAQEYVVSSSTIYQTSINLSGSSKFGDTDDDIHQFTGSLIVSNSLYVQSGSSKVGIGTTSPNTAIDVYTAQDHIARFKSSDNKGYISIADNDTDGFISAENDKLSLGAYTGVNDNNLNIDLSTNRVGIGTSSPSHLLDVVGNGWEAGGIRVHSTSSNGAALFLQNSQREFGIYSRDNVFDIRDITDSDSSRFVIDATGEVGIGTRSPQAQLDVRGTGALAMFSSSAGYQIEFDLAGEEKFDLSHGTSGLYFRKSNVTLAGVTQNHDFSFFDTSGNQYANFDGSSGKVHIGSNHTSNPAATLDVRGDISASDDIRISNNKQYEILDTTGTARRVALLNNSNAMAFGDLGITNNYYYAGDTHRFITSVGTDMVVSNGKVGIGTTNPQALLQVLGDISSSGDLTIFNGVNKLHYDISSQQINSEGATLNFAGTDFSFNTDDLFIDQSTSKIGIGTQVAPSTLTVQGDISASNGIYLQNNKSIHWENQGVSAGSIRAESNSLKYITKLNGDHIFRSGSTDLFYIDSSEQKIGININNPSYTLDLGNNSTSEIRSHRYRTNNGYLDSTGADVRISSDSDLQIAATKVGIGTTNPAFTLDVYGDAGFKDSIGTSSFASGFTGQGWRIESNEDNKWGLTADNLTIRGTMNVYELLVNQTRATNGSVFVTSTGKVDHMSGSLGAVRSGSTMLTDYPSADDLVLHYTFNENQNGKLYDFSPNKLHTTDVNNVKSGSTYSKFSNGSGLDFKAGESHIDINVPTESLGLSPRRWSVCVWANLADRGAHNQRFLNFTTSSTSVPYLSFHHASHPLLYLDAGSEDYYVYGNQVITGSGWHHIAFVFDDKEDGASTDDIIKEIYIDGLMATGSGPETGWGGGANPWNTTNFTDQWRIGHPSQTSTLSGSIDDLRVYKRALTGLEIEALYSASEGIVIKTGDQANHGFSPGDVIRAQRFTGTGTYQSDAVVTRVENTTTFALEPHSVKPEIGFEYVRLGNIVYTSRQGSVYMTADDDNAPFIDIVDGITHHSDFNSASGSGGVKARVGKLTGVSSTTFGNLSGYGLYSDNVYLEGGIKATFGELGGFGITSNAISSSDNTFILSSSTQDVSLKMGTTANAMTLDDGTGFFVSGSGDFRVGNPSADQIKFASGVLQITSSQINLSGSGVGIDTSTFELDAVGLDISSTERKISLGEGKLVLTGSSVPVIKLDGGEISASNFLVNAQGEMSASAGLIGGWKITDTTIENSNNIYLTTATTNGQIWLGSNAYSTAKIGFDGSGAGFVANQSMSWDSSGNLQLTASRVDISGSDVNIQTPSFFFGSATNNISSSADDLSITTKNLTASGSSVELLTPNFLLGSATSFISGSSNGLKIRSGEFLLSTSNLTIDSDNEKIDLGGELVLQAGSNPKLSISGSAGNDTIKLEQSAGVSLFSFVKTNHSDNTAGLYLSAEEDEEFKLWLGSNTKYLKFNNTDGLDILTDNAKLSGSNVEILTPSFMFGDKGTSYISSSTSQIEISSSAFHLQNNGQVTGSNVLFKGGKIGGFDITGTRIHTSNHIEMDASNKRFTINANTFGNDGIQLEYNGGNPRAYIGDGTSGLKFDGTNLQVSGTNVDLSTPSFELGDATTNISGSNGSIGIVGNVTMSNSVLIDGGLTVGNLPELPTEEGLMTYFSFNGGLSGSLVGTPLLDNSGNGRNTTGITGTPKFADGIFGNSVLFESESLDFIKIDNADFDFGRNDSFTLSVWAKRFHPNTGSADPNPDDDGDGHNSNSQAILTKGAYDFSYGIDYRHETNQIRAGVRDQNNNTNLAAYTIDDDLLEWHHIVMTYTSASTIDLYVDGEFKSSDTIDHPDDFYSTGDNLEIGGNNILSGNSSYYNGYIDEVRVYTGSLSKSQIRALYLNPGGLGNTTIAGDQISTGIIKSNTYSATEGTELDLNNATFKLGGSANPALSWDGSNLKVSGSSTEILTPSFFFGSDASHISGSATGVKILTNEAKISGSSVEIQTDSYMLGDKGKSYISSSGTELRISASNFDLRNGNVTASNVQLSGSIKATAGDIGGFNISTNQINDDDSDLVLKDSGQITGSKVLFDGGIIGGFGVTEERLFTDVSGQNSVEISSLSGSVLTRGIGSASLAGETTPYAIVGSFGQTWRGGFSGKTGIDIGTYKLIGSEYNSLFRIDEVSQSIAGWDFDSDSIFNDNFFLSSSRSSIIIKDLRGNETVRIGSGSLSQTNPIVANKMSNGSFEDGLESYFTSSAGHDGTDIVHGVDTLNKPSGHGNTRVIEIEVTGSNAATGGLHYRIRVAGSARTN